MANSYDIKVMRKLEKQIMDLEDKNSKLVKALTSIAKTSIEDIKLLPGWVRSVAQDTIRRNNS